MPHLFYLSMWCDIDEILKILSILDIPRFFYSMYGKHVDRLNVYVQTGLTLPQPTWTKVGAQGRDWREADVDITTTRSFKVHYLHFLLLI